MDPDQIARLKDPEALRNLLANARRLGREDVARMTFRRLCSLEGEDLEDPVEREFRDVLSAYEELLTEKHGRTTKAMRSRQKLASKGVVQCLIAWAIRPPTEGFNLLMEKGLPELTAEYLVIKYADRFPPEAVAAARKPLGDKGPA